ncbi:MAG: DUF4040 domain-containing protein [Actinomycetota bacterium]|nr:DUF4040 domain-containing protein [Actinomycetota bacterium]
MTALLCLHLVAGLACITGGERIGRAVYALGAAPLVATLGWLAFQLPDVLDGDPVTEHRPWVSTLGLALDFRLDGFAALMLLLVSGIGLAVFVYAAAYDKPGEGVARQMGLLTIFAGAMTGLVVADDLLVLVTCWELTSITSYFLIGNRHRSPRARAAALHALLITGAGGMCLLAGAVLLGRTAGTMQVSEILADPPGGVGAALILLLLGAFTKSAQYPFHGWLPGAMIAPTPISAYLHSATMVKAGVLLIARLAPAFATYGWWRPCVLGVGAVTMLGGGVRALRQHDLKLLLAFGTVSQLGFLVVLAGMGTPEATVAACVLLLAHGAFKASLFFVVGMLDHELGTRDLRELPVLGRAWRPVAVVTVVAAASMAGVPLVFGFIAKEAAYEALARGTLSSGALLLAAVVTGSMLTAAYSWRFAWGILGEPRRRTLELDAERAAAAERRPAAGLVGPALVLAGLTLVVGVVPGIADRLVDGAARALDGRTDHVHLALWHGWGAPIALTALTFLGAALIVVVLPQAIALRERGPDLWTSGDAYRLLLRGLNRGSDRITGVVQSGSLPVYAGVILATAALLPTAALLFQGDLRTWPDFVNAPAHLAIGALLLGAALAAATIRRRLSAVLFLGLAGYGMAGLFVIQGAPDLALTQVTVETLSTVLFVLVLRRLPVNFEPKSTTRIRALRIVVASAVAAGVFFFALQVGTVRDETPVTDEIIERALPDGNGRNVVNVILVDIRGLDTLGEITVLATASIGMVALARAGRRPNRRRPAPTEPAPTGADA